MAKNSTPARSKVKDGQPISICNRYLPLLGFDDKCCQKEDLFVVPNREAFHLVSDCNSNAVIGHKIFTLYCLIQFPTNA